MPRKHQVQDPHARREAEKYENPIPSREFILDHLEKRGKPATHDELCDELQLAGEESQEALRRRLIAMSRDGQLISNRRGLFGLVDKMDLVRGRVQGNKDGFGFLIPDDGGEDLFLSPNQMRKVFDGDRAIARVSGLDRRGRREGKIVEVMERRSTQLVGRYYNEAGVGLVWPQNRRITQEILIPPRKHKKAREGDYVLVNITSFPYDHHKATGEVIEVLGDHAKPGVEIEVTLRAHDIPHEWPKEITSHLKRYPKAPTPAECERRIDLRDLHFVTIDGEDAKDFDDAVYCRPAEHGGWTLFVAIADVSHYVGVNTPLDVEAQERGNSVYFPGHVVPMLPEVLSNGLCSLKPDVDRLVMVCELDIAPNGEMKDYRFFEGVIHSHARLTYNEVAAILQKPADEREERVHKRMREKYAALVGDLENLHALYRSLKTLREKRGALDFDKVETRIVFSEERKIREIIPVERNEAHRLIEECMLCANVASADFLLNSNLPALYRVHEGPNPEKLGNLYDFLREMGIGLARKERPTPADYSQILDRLKTRPDYHLLSIVVIRSLMQAMYQPENLGHFGLGYDAYTHFTSPIRRYPDLLVHRAIRYLLRNRRQKQHVLKSAGAKALTRKEIYPYQLQDLEALGEHLSGTERRADSASYDVIDWLKCEYMKDHLGAEFEGTVVSVTAFGLFVELADIYIEGLIHVTALDNDYYHFNPARHSLSGERSGLSYHLGDSLRVIVARVDVDERQIDLQPISKPVRLGGVDGGTAHDAEQAPRGKGGKGKGRKKGAAKGKDDKGGKRAAGTEAGGKGARTGGRSRRSSGGRDRKERSGPRTRRS